MTKGVVLNLSPTPLEEPTMQSLNIDDKNIIANSPHSCHKESSAPSEQASDVFIVKLYPQISVTALNLGKDKEIALWYALRAVATTGSGKIDVALARERLKGQYTRSNFYRTLRRGEGEFWEIVEGDRGPRISLYGADKVALFFEIAYLSRPHSIPLEKFGSTVKQRRAWLYTSLFKPDDPHPKPISRLSIEEATGVERKRQRRYEKSAGVKRYPNFATSRNEQQSAAVMEDHRPVDFIYAGENRGGELSPAWMIVKSSSKKDMRLTEYKKQRRLGNTYISGMAPAGKSLVKKVNKKLKATGLLIDGLQHPRFFDQAKALISAREKGKSHEEPFLRVKNTIRRGRLEWEEVNCIDYCSLL